MDEALGLIGSGIARVRARALGLLVIGAALVAILADELPHRRDAGDRVLLAVSAGALAWGVVLVLGAADRARPWVMHVQLAVMQVTAAVAYLAGGGPTNDIRYAYVWLAPYLALCFPMREAVAQMAGSGLVIAIALTLHRAPPADVVRLWMTTFGTTVAVGAVVMWVANEWRAREVALYRASRFDSLTGLANRTEFETRTREMLTRREEEGGRVALFLADIDRFKTINDTRGHNIGDEVLVGIADALRSVAPIGGFVARLGGDEFALIVEDPDGYLDQQGVVRAMVGIWGEPMATAIGGVAVSACVGVASSTPGDTPSSLLRDAEAAMLQAKAEGAGTVTSFHLEQRKDVARAYAIEHGLREAAALGQFRLVFQPVVEITTARIRACEVLLRWNHPDLGEVSPGEFIPVAETRGLIGPIGAWVLEQAVGQLGRWLADGTVGPEFRITVNVSGHQLHADLPRTIKALLDEHGVSPDMVMIELTETVIISGNAETNETLAALRAMGLALVLDDFGTGFSSLSHLQRASFDCVKIDRSFVRGVVEHGTDRSIVSAIIALAEALDIAVVAEGVESRAQAEALRGLGCRFGQGYLFDRPLPAEDLATRLVRPPLRAVGVTDLTLGRQAG